jgi:uracil-DNA glycosylase
MQAIVRTPRLAKLPMLEIAQIRQALLQSLENYRRCGLLRIPRATAEMLPAEMLAVIEQARSPATASLPIAASLSGSSPATISATQNLTTQNSAVPTSANAIQAPTPYSVAPAVVAETRPESEMVAERPWSLPSLSILDRKSHLEMLDEEVKSCRKCTDIVCFRQQTVFGAGPLQPTVCFMGEAPGADEDRSGQPFVGRAGQLLTKIIEAMQLKRDDVYILNALKCRPPQNRTPVPEEIEHCHPFVETQLEVLQPKYIVCLGAVAVRSLLGLTLPVGSLRGRFHQYRQARVVVTYHPSYLLRNESAKKLVWQDMQMLMREMGLKPPGPSSK